MHIRRVIVCSALLASLACSSVPACAATNTCARFGTVQVAEGVYVYQNNVWNSSQTQCASVDTASGAWTITQANFDLPTNGPPASYPSIVWGCHFGNCTARNPLPIPVSKLGSVGSSWRTTQVDAGAYNVAYDIWTNSSPSTSGQPNGSEIMIWLNSRGVQPVGSKVGTATIGGATWSVWTSRMSGWNYVAYQRTAGVASVTDLDLKPFILDSVNRGSTRAAWYLIAVEAGFEIWKGGSGLGSELFSVSPTSAKKARPRAVVTARSTGTSRHPC